MMETTAHGNPITLEEAKTLDAFARFGTIAKTGSALRKANSAIVYALDSIEKKTDLKLFDRSGYRTEFLPAGERVLQQCRKVLAASNELQVICEELKSGVESDLVIVMEGVVPVEPVIAVIQKLSREGHPTRFHLNHEYMGDVETTFLNTGASLMISVLPPETIALESAPLFSVHASLVVSKDHPLTGPKKWKASDLSRYPILTVKGSSPKLEMSTQVLEVDSRIQFNDFHAKKAALLAGLGYGWLPHYLMREELRSGKLVRLNWEGSNRHLFKSKLYYRSESRLGKVGLRFIQELKRTENFT